MLNIGSFKRQDKLRKTKRKSQVDRADEAVLKSEEPQMSSIMIFFVFTKNFQQRGICDEKVTPWES